MRLSPEQPDSIIVSSLARRERLARQSELRNLILAIPTARVEQLISLQEVELVQVQRDRATHPRYIGGAIDPSKRKPSWWL